MDQNTREYLGFKEYIDLLKDNLSETSTYPILHVKAIQHIQKWLIRHVTHTDLKMVNHYTQYTRSS